MEKSVSLFNVHNLENVLQRNLRTGTATECNFRASGGTRFKNFRQPWWQKGGGGTPRCNRSAQKNSGYVTDNGTSFRLCWKENLLKYQRVSKYYENDCSYSLRACSTCSILPVEKVNKDQKK